MAMPLIEIDPSLRFLQHPEMFNTPNTEQIADVMATHAGLPDKAIENFHLRILEGAPGDHPIGFKSSPNDTHLGVINLRGMRSALETDDEVLLTDQWAQKYPDNLPLAAAHAQLHNMLVMMEAEQIVANGEFMDVLGNLGKEIIKTAATRHLPVIGASLLAGMGLAYAQHGDELLPLLGYGIVAALPSVIRLGHYATRNIELGAELELYDALDKSAPEVACLFVSSSDDPEVVDALAGALSFNIQ